MCGVTSHHVPLFALMRSTGRGSFVPLVSVWDKSGRAASRSHENEARDRGKSVPGQEHKKGRGICNREGPGRESGGKRPQIHGQHIGARHKEQQKRPESQPLRPSPGCTCVCTGGPCYFSAI